MTLRTAETDGRDLLDEVNKWSKVLRLARLPEGEEEVSAFIAAKGPLQHQATMQVARRRSGTSKTRYRLQELIPTNTPADPTDEIIRKQYESSTNVDEILNAIFPGTSPPARNATPFATTDPEGRSVQSLELTEALARTLPQPWEYIAGRAGETRLDWIQKPKWSAGKIFRWTRATRTAEMQPEDLQVLRSTVQKEMWSGALRYTGTLSYLQAQKNNVVKLISPIHIVRSGSSSKPRLIHDLRALNDLLHPAPTSYEGVQDALALGGRYATKIDLQSAFKSVRMNAEDRPYLAFQVDGHVWRWECLPFGLVSAPRDFGRLLALTVEKARRRGVACAVYVDDIYITSFTVAGLDADVRLLIEVLIEDGWSAARDKVFLRAHTRITFLGLLLYVGEGVVTIPRSKADKLASLVKDALQLTRIPLPTLQKILGLLSFFLPAWPAIGLYWRGMVAAAAEAAGLPGRHVWKRGALLHELQFWEKAAADLPRLSEEWGRRPKEYLRPWSLVTDASEHGIGAVSWPGGHPAPPVEQKTGNMDLEKLARDAGRLGSDHTSPTARVQEQHVTFTTSSTSAWGGATLIADKLSVEALGESSAYRELEALSTALSRLHAQPPGIMPFEWKVVHWYSDSTAATSALLKWRSASLEVTNILQRLWTTTSRFKVVVHPHWVSRSCGWIPAADWLSRKIGRRLQAEWAVDGEDFQHLVDNFKINPDLDLFATRSNKKCDQFCSRYPELGSLGPAGPGNWKGRVVWAFPPFSQVSQFLNLWRRTPGRAALALLPAQAPALDKLRRDGLVLREKRWKTELRLRDVHGERAPAPLRRQLVVALLKGTPEPGPKRRRTDSPRRNGRETENLPSAARRRTGRG